MIYFKILTIFYNYYDYININGSFALIIYNITN